MGRAKRSAGFTLLELVIVMTILLIMSGGVVPVFRTTFGNVTGDHAVRDCVAAVKYAQERAICSATGYRMYLDPDNGRYYLAQQRPSERGELLFERLSGPEGRDVVLPERLTMLRPKAKKDRETGLYYIRFHPSGSCDTAIIHFQRNDGKRYRIEMDGTAGKMRVHDR